MAVKIYKILACLSLTVLVLSIWSNSWVPRKVNYPDVPGTHNQFFTAEESKVPVKAQVLPESQTDNGIKIERLVASFDKDSDGIPDADDIIHGARKQVELQPKYIVDYYKGGYPPENIAVCTDVVSRAFMNAGYDLKTMIDKDISANIKSYPRVEGKPDPNIDFRRVRNMVPFFKKYAQTLTKDIKPGDKKNLYEWQGGDLVVFYWTGNEHIAVVSDKRNSDGIPYLIHTYGSYPKEDDRLLDWADTIVYHFRYPAVTANNKK